MTECCDHSSLGIVSFLTLYYTFEIIYIYIYFTSALVINIEYFIFIITFIKGIVTL